MPCEVIWTEPEIEAACREWYAAQKALEAAPEKLPLGRLAVLARRARKAQVVAGEALSSMVEPACPLRDLRVTIVLGDGGVFVHDHPRPRCIEWQVY